MRPARVMRLHKMWAEMFMKARVNAKSDGKSNEHRGNGKTHKKVLATHDQIVLKIGTESEVTIRQY